MVLVQLFLTFLLVGCVSFGGGYAMLPLMHEEVVIKYGWISAQQFTEMIALSGMAPGPIGTNSAILIGNHVSGFAGAVVAVVGMILPSLVIVVLASVMFVRVWKSQWFHSVFYGLRPIITALVIYSAYIFASQIEGVFALNAYNLGLVVIFLLSLAAITYFQIHPLYVILLSGLAGSLVYA